MRIRTPITTNLAFGEWPKVTGGDEKLTTALLDRLAENAVILTTKGKSFRIRRHGGAPEPAPQAAESTNRKTKTG